MTSLYVAWSPLMQEWGGDVGISKHLYKVGLTDEDPKAAVTALIDGAYAGQNDWQLAGERVTEFDGTELAARLAARQKLVDPLYYPRIKGAKDIVKVEQRKVEANLVIKRTMEGRDSKVPKLKPADYAAYIMDSLG